VTGFWYPVYEALEPFVQDVKLAHPLKVRAIAEARIKTDKIDSEILAHLLRIDLLPTAYIPSKSCGMMSSKIKYTTPANQILLF
jgi:transposase